MRQNEYIRAKNRLRNKPRTSPPKWYSYTLLSPRCWNTNIAYQGAYFAACYLLVVVGALKELDPGVERPAVSLDKDLGWERSPTRREVWVYRKLAEGPLSDGRTEYRITYKSWKLRDFPAPSGGEQQKADNGNQIGSEKNELHGRAEAMLNDG